MTNQCFGNMNRIVVLIILTTVLISCEPSPYKRLIDRELSRGIIIDSMPFGLQLGSSKKDFYDRCWKLNKEGIITQGPGNEFARYFMEPKDSLGKRIDMLFYGIFDAKDMMTGFRMKFSYTGWAPWNEAYQSIHLKEAIEDTLMKWYPGNDFIDLKLKNDKTFASYKIEGNLEFKLIKIDDRQIAVRIEDLRSKQ